MCIHLVHRCVYFYLYLYIHFVLFFIYLFIYIYIYEHAILSWAKNRKWNALDSDTWSSHTSQSPILNTHYPIPWPGTFLTFLIKVIKNHKRMILSNLFAQETFADAGDGDEGGGADHLGPFGTILRQLLDHFRTPYAKYIYVSQPNINFLEMAHTNFVSSVRITS